ncbi:hypothetical protein M436DRAFT_76192 [Aureobasidium namibiae CBS 147.97]|uniref:Uncharacterized protein n=1 Tax=Aureobasidium namibiae CBS 147.97 TaxID=1043004 RepID=A0A074W8Q5_9PEZI|nr:uncharacterized protein M436DRAFT_76192 [Aureobasidium namibiae CBS 147.97]KEQ69258.1 hypothetical protein M436DRAFT_76192 [Aureobasidium namibiae CBS 147.97]
MSVIMKSLLSRPKGLVNLPLWTPSLTRPFSLCHAHQKLWIATDRTRFRDRVCYKRNKERFNDRAATQQPEDFYWPTSRYLNDPIWRAERLAYRKAIYARKEKHDEIYSMRAKIRNWVRTPWVREELPWKTHRPIRYDEKTEHHCAGCKFTRTGGGKLHWQSLVDPDVYLCTSCYVPSESPDWNKIMPEGYEDVRNMKAMRARKEQLDASEAPSS